MCLLAKALEHNMTHGYKVIIRPHLIAYVTRLHMRRMACKAALNARGNIID